MKCLIGTLIAVAVSCVGGSVFAQEATGIPDEIIKEFEWFVGTWKSEGKVGDETQTGGITLRWASTKDGGKVGLIGRYSYTAAGETRNGVNLIGWNAAEKCIEDRGFDALGDNGSIHWFIETDRKWRGEIVRVRDGETVEAKADLIKMGDAKLVIESESKDGEVSRIVYKKVQRKGKKRKE